MPWRQWTTLFRKSWAEMIPHDPVILLSFVNARLRDEFSDLDELCGALDVSREELERRLKDLGYAYNEKTNQFK